MMRCLALAETMAGLGFVPRFLSAAGSTNVLSALSQSGFPAVDVGLGQDGVEQARAAGMGLQSLAVIDHYGLGRETERKFANSGVTTLAFEDLPNRPHAAAILLDPTPGRSASEYKALVPPETRVLAGSAYALMRPVWRSARRKRGAGPPDGIRIVVSVGATDPMNATGRIVEALKTFDAPIDIILGASAQHLDDVRRKLGPHMTLHIDPPDMPMLLVRASLAIGAAGTSSFERCLLGLPSIAIPVVDNQANIAAALTGSGAAEVLQVEILDRPQALLARVAALAGDSERRRAMAAAARVWCDGRGALRLIAALTGQETARDGNAVTLRLAEVTDSDWLLALQSRPETRRYARNPAVPTSAEHAAWCGSVMDNPDRVLCVIEHNGERCGFIRLDRRLTEGRPRFEVSISIDPDHHRNGLGAAALSLTRRLAPGAELDAAIDARNAASQALFVRAGYGQVEPELYRSLPQ
jgi:UDP-2,4-diacetamido-2,4,6-trideoxy-beta-L-altropyranose hydrolase